MGFSKTKKKNWQKIKLEASIRAGLKITEIEVSLHPLQTSRNSKENCILRNMFRGVTVLQVVVLHWLRQESPSKHSPRQRDAKSGTSGSISLLESSRKEKSSGSAARSDLILTFTPLHLSSRSPFYMAEPKEYFKQSSQLFCCTSEVF